MKKKSVKKSVKTEDSIEFDLSNIKKNVNNMFSSANNFSKNSPKIFSSLIILFLLIISMSFSYSVRNDSVSLEITEVWAAQTINNRINQQATTVVREKFPTLQGESFNQRVSETANSIRSQYGDNLDSQIKAQGEIFRERLQVEMADGSQQTLQ